MARPRGRMTLAGLGEWEQQRERETERREELRGQRARALAERRWRKGSRAADARKVWMTMLAPSHENAAACLELAESAAACAAAGVPGRRWSAVEAAARRRAEELTPRRLTVAQRRRRQREQGQA